MAYVGIKGGAAAIRAAAEAMEYQRTAAAASQQPLAVEQIRVQLHALVSRLLSEGGLYHPGLAALALKQTCGDSLEAGFMMRAFRSTRPRLGTTALHEGGAMRLIRRISSTFKEVPGGQHLGPTGDFGLRLFRMELLDEDPAAFRAVAERWLAQLPGAGARPGIDSVPKVLGALRAEGLAPALHRDPPPAFDITRDPLLFPVPRSAGLATMARAETGSLLALAYSSMRGYGDIHPTVAELRVGYLPVLLPHPLTGEPVECGEVLMTECEVVAMYGGGSAGAPPAFTLGYGACFGHNETKAVCMAILDRAMQKGMAGKPQHPAEDPEFVLLHIDGTDSMGFCNHYKMPHYVTFQSDLDRLRATRAAAQAHAAARQAGQAPGAAGGDAASAAAARSGAPA
jgi:alpha-D-ribose 1-methylphosphonate 5-triphosphate synthase subunit PhnI